MQSRDCQADMRMTGQSFEKKSPFPEFVRFFERIETGVQYGGDFPEDRLRSRIGKRCGGGEGKTFCVCGILRGAFSGNPPEDEDFESGVSPDPVASVDSSYGLSGGEESWDSTLAPTVDPNSAERGMSSRFHFKSKTFEIRFEPLEFCVVFRIFSGKRGFADGGKIVEDSTMSESVASVDFAENSSGQFAFPGNRFSGKEKGMTVPVPENRTFMKYGGYDRESGRFGREYGDRGLKLYTSESGQFRARIGSQDQSISPQIPAPGGEFPEAGKSAACENHSFCGDPAAVLRNGSADGTLVFQQLNDSHWNWFRVEKVDRLFPGRSSAVHDAGMGGTDGIDGIVSSIRQFVESDPQPFQSPEFRDRPFCKSPSQQGIRESAAGGENIPEKEFRGIVRMNRSREPHDLRGGRASRIAQKNAETGIGFADFRGGVPAGESAADDQDIRFDRLHSQMAPLASDPTFLLNSLRNGG